MPRRFWRQRIFALLIVVLSMGISIAAVAFLYHPTAAHGTISQSSSVSIPPGNQTYAQYNYLAINGLSDGQNFAVGVRVVNGTAHFCVLQDGYLRRWIQTGVSGFVLNSTFPWNYCITQSLTSSDVLYFQPTSSGIWDIAALNASPGKITVLFLPAP